MSYRQIAQKQWRPETYRCRVHLPTPGCKGLLETLHLKAVRVTPTLPAWGRHPRGCEAAVHATRSFIAQTQGEKVLLKLDVKNAFNSIRRDTVLQAAQPNTPPRNLPFHLGLLFFKNISISWRFLS